MTLFKKLAALAGSKEQQASVQPIIKKKNSNTGVAKKPISQKNVLSGPEIITKKESMATLPACY